MEGQVRAEMTVELMEIKSGGVPSCARKVAYSGLDMEVDGEEEPRMAYILSSTPVGRRVVGGREVCRGTGVRDWGRESGDLFPFIFGRRLCFSKHPAF